MEAQGLVRKRDRRGTEAPVASSLCLGWGRERLRPWGAGFGPEPCSPGASWCCADSLLSSSIPSAIMLFSLFGHYALTWTTVLSFPTAKHRDFVLFNSVNLGLTNMLVITNNKSSILIYVKGFFFLYLCLILSLPKCLLYLSAKHITN